MRKKVVYPVIVVFFLLVVGSTVFDRNHSAQVSLQKKQLNVKEYSDEPEGITFYIGPSTVETVEVKETNELASTSSNTFGYSQDNMPSEPPKPKWDLSTAAGLDEFCFERMAAHSWTAPEQVKIRFERSPTETHYEEEGECDADTCTEGVWLWVETPEQAEMPESVQTEVFAYMMQLQSASFEEAQEIHPLLESILAGYPSSYIKMDIDNVPPGWQDYFNTRRLAFETMYWGGTE